MARTKIVCTIGPASEQLETQRAMLEAGMDAARLNFSHGTPQSHRVLHQRLRQVAREAGQPLCLIQDLAGPKIRIGTFSEGSVFLRPGDPFTLTTEPLEGDEKQVHVPFDSLTDVAQAGRRILLADGLIELQIVQVQPPRVVTEVQVGGWLSDRKGICFPGQALPLAALTPKDRRDLEVGLELGMDYIALSFVRSHQDVLELKALIAERNSPAKVIAKLERPEALEDLEAILEVSDAVMVARGDLGIELEPEKVPLIQKRIIQEAQHRDVYVITATQMLESMIHSPRPTRAETSDVANAVLDGTDAVMLSGETATGEYPVRAVEIMERIVRETESAGLKQRDRRAHESIHQGSFPGAISWAAGHIAEITGARAICAFTHSGATAKLISKSHPRVPIVGLTPSQGVLTQLNLAWGVTPVEANPVPGLDEMIEEVERVIRAQQLADVGDTIVIVAGFPFGRPGLTNLLKIHRVGEPDLSKRQSPERT